MMAPEEFSSFASGAIANDNRLSRESNMSNATLGFQIDSSQASSAAADLDRLTAAATRTQQAADKLEAEAKLLGSAFGSAGTGAGKALPAVDGLGKKLQEQDEHVRSFRMKLERLTLKYQPLARATQSYLLLSSAGRISVVVDG